MHAHPAADPGVATCQPFLHRLSGAAGACLRWWQAPLWFAAIFTGAKSFADNPILGSRALNSAGLHVWRLKAAHALAQRRRARLAHLVPAELREAFERDGFVVVPNLLPAEAFARLQDAVLQSKFECRAQQQGDTITRRVPFGPELRRLFPSLAGLVDDCRWRNLMAFVASTKSPPLYYLQTILGGAAAGPADPQAELHSDTFHPSMKAWLFLTDVPEDGRPLTYVRRSHRLSDARIAWEKRKSIEVLAGGDRLSQRGSFRIRPEELAELGLPPPTRFSVRANTLVIVDTCGFHARATSDRPTVRAELWAYCRRSPFLPWISAGPLSFRAIADRRAGWLLSFLDALGRAGVRKQHWQTIGSRRPLDP